MPGSFASVPARTLELSLGKHLGRYACPRPWLHFNRTSPTDCSALLHGVLCASSFRSGACQHPPLVAASAHRHIDSSASQDQGRSSLQPLVLTSPLSTTMATLQPHVCNRLQRSHSVALSTLSASASIPVHRLHRCPTPLPAASIPVQRRCQLLPSLSNAPASCFHPCPMTLPAAV